MNLEKIEPFYVTDTNALIWFITNDKRLSPNVAQIFAAAESGETQIVISSITMAELYYSDKKWGLFDDFAATAASILTKPSFQFIDFRADDVLDFDQDAAISEMHDRIIAGLARRLRAPLLTADQQITAAGVVPVVW